MRIGRNLLSKSSLIVLGIAVALWCVTTLAVARRRAQFEAIPFYEANAKTCDALVTGFERLAAEEEAAAGLAETDSPEQLKRLSEAASYRRSASENQRIGDSCRDMIERLKVDR